MSGEIVKKTSEVSLDLTKGLSLEGLSGAQRQSLIYKAQEAKISIAKDLAERQTRLQSSSADIDVTINTANRLEQGKNDYHVQSSHATASGHTEVKVSRNANNGMLAVIVIIGIVLILVLAKAL